MAEFGIETVIEPGRTGSFEITRDGTLLYSKLEAGRFPEDDEIRALGDS